MKSPDPLASVLADTLATILAPIVKEAVREAMSENGQRGNTNFDAARPFLTVKEAAQLSNLGASTLRLYIRRRQLRAQKVGRRVLIKKTDLERFLDANPIEVVMD